LSRGLNLRWAALLRLYPRTWRDQYGAELIAVMTNGRTSPRDIMDVAVTGLRERARSIAPQGDAPKRACDGSLLVVWAWSLLVIAGIAVQRTSEHWQDATAGAPQASHLAFSTLEVAAISGAVLVFIGVAAATPSVLRFLIAGGWATVRRPVFAAGSATFVAALALLTLVAWAHHLSSVERAGGSSWYAGFYLLSSVAVAVCLLSWARAAAAVARTVNLPSQVLRVEARLAGATAAAMLIVSASSTLWWGATARNAPQFFTGWSTTIIATATIVMFAATALGIVGAIVALRSAQHLPVTPT
jgi:hypothetical protein